MLDIVCAKVWELDPVMITYLDSNLVALRVHCEIHEEDFVLDSVGRIEFMPGTRFTHAILNPPYLKSVRSQHMVLLADRLEWSPEPFKCA